MPVDSIPTNVTPWSASQPRGRSSCTVVVPNVRTCWSWVPSGARHAHARGDGVAVRIKPRAAFNDPFHGDPSCQFTRRTGHETAPQELLHEEV
jgi:hypothetical protein